MACDAALGAIPPCGGQHLLAACRDMDHVPLDVRQSCPHCLFVYVNILAVSIAARRHDLISLGWPTPTPRPAISLSHSCRSSRIGFLCLEGVAVGLGCPFAIQVQN